MWMSKSIPWKRVATKFDINCILLLVSFFYGKLIVLSLLNCAVFWMIFVCDKVVANVEFVFYVTVFYVTYWLILQFWS